MHPRAAYDRIRFAEFEVDLGSGELFCDGRKLLLQEQPFQVLRILLERPGQLVTREELRNQLWSADTFVDFDHGLNKAVAKLREALAQADGESPLIETLPRRGYRLIAPVEWVNGIAPAESVNGNHSAAPKSLPTVSQSGLSQKTGESWISRAPGRVILFSLAVIALLGLGSTLYIFRRSAVRPSMTTSPLTTFPGAETQPAFSSDGKQVSFIWDGNSSNRTDVYMKRIGTERPLQLTQSSGFVCCDVWSPDDRYNSVSTMLGRKPGRLHGAFPRRTRKETSENNRLCGLGLVTHGTPSRFRRQELSRHSLRLVSHVPRRPATTPTDIPHRQYRG
jgi:DNA-binding winged helix-turn-helix (wHTH) protein